MSALVITTLGTITIGLGLGVLVFLARPAAPSLDDAVAMVRAAPVVGHRPVPASPARWSRIAERLGGGIREQDLQILGTTRAKVVTSRLGVCLAVLFGPTVLGLVLAVAGVRLPLALPAGLGLVMAVATWFVQERSLHADAEKLRAEFMTAYTAYLSLVSLERAVRGSPSEALREAARVSTSWPFALIAAELTRAQAAGQAPWEALRALGERIGVARLSTLADIVSVADDGGAVFHSLLAEARSLRTQQRSEAKTQANVISERLGVPLGVIALAPAVLGMIPALVRLFST